MPGERDQLKQQQKIKILKCSLFQFPVKSIKFSFVIFTPRNFSLTPTIADYEGKKVHEVILCITCT